MAAAANSKKQYIIYKVIMVGSGGVGKSALTLVGIVKFFFGMIFFKNKKIEKLIKFFF